MNNKNLINKSVDIICHSGRKYEGIILKINSANFSNYNDDDHIVLESEGGFAEETQVTFIKIKCIESITYIKGDGS